jgi:hypothetical protein
MDFEQANGIEAELDDDMIGQEQIQPPPPRCVKFPHISSGDNIQNIFHWKIY